MNLVDTYTVTISVRGIDLLALEKLSLVNHALADRFTDYRVRTEQKTIVTVLDDLIRQIKLKAGGATS